MKLLFLTLLACFCLVGFTTEPAEETKDLEPIKVEVEETLVHFFDYIENHELESYVAGIRHASRARLLLEQYLGEDIDNFSRQDAEELNYSLRLIAKRVDDLSGEAGRELWRDPRDTKALLRLSELHQFAKNLP